LELGTLKGAYTGLLVGQWSTDQLFSSEQISLGGFSSVRGSRSSLFFGDTGIYGRNELSLELTKPQPSDSDAFFDIGDLSAFAAFDIGHIVGRSEINQSDVTLGGWTVGLRNSKSNFNFDIGYSDIAF